MKNNQQQIININTYVYLGKPQTPGKNPTNEISLNIGQNPGQSCQVSFHRSPPSLHYSEVFPAFYRLHYMQYHGLKPWVHNTMCPKTTTIYPSQH